MSSRIRTADIEHALQQAANSARNGSAAARSGQIGLEARIVQRILSDAQNAVATWANWEAINDQLLPGKRTAAAVDHLGLVALGAIRTALCRDALLSAYRLSDSFNPKNAVQAATLCRMVHITSDRTFQEKLRSNQWALDLGSSPYLADEVARENANRLDRLHERVPVRWASDKPLLDPELQKLRDVIKPARNNFLAPPVDVDRVPFPSVNDIRRLIRLTLDLATDLAFLFLGSTIDAENFQSFASEQAAKFWQIAFKAPIDSLEAFEARRSSEH